MTRSIFAKLLISYIIVILICTLSLGSLLSYLIRNYVVDTKVNELSDKGVRIVTFIEPVIAAGHAPAAPTLDAIGDLMGATLWVVDQRGTLLAGNPPPRWFRTFPEDSVQIEALFNGIPQTWVRPNRRQVDPSVVVALPVKGTVPPTALFMYSPITGINKTVDKLERLLAYSIVLGILVATFFGFGISRGITRPIANISQAARRFAGGDYNSRTTAAGNDEVGSLGHTFNHMAESLSHIEQNRREFLANVTHELKTPVASIQALAETLLDGLAATPEKKQRFLTTIVSETQRITRLINDLLDLAQLEAGEVSIRSQPLDIGEFLSAEIDKFFSLAAEKSIALLFNPPAQSSHVWADPDRLSQICSNLISNAIRYSPEHSTIELLVRPNRTVVEIAVKDSGSGIPAEDLPHIWERFYTVDRSRARSYGGTGLGLAITQKLVHAMQGEITVTSQPGSGSTFTFTLPIYTGNELS